MQSRPQRDKGIARTSLLVACIAVLGIAVVTVGVVRIVDHGKSPNAVVQQDIRNAAAAEQLILSKTSYYSDNALSLRQHGFMPHGDATISVRVFGSVHFCIVGARTESITWYFYDSEVGEISATTYASRALAETACTIPVSGPGSYHWFNQIYPLTPQQAIVGPSA